ncbi:hypothetical protein ACFV7Q_29935 [Streptomyces sp. NPDC059851]|uniref:hypothetical protein n=1 Tax=Streptomyces sp. NPDC059851 TaxID=3346971 RepID=UPI003661B05D
MAADRTPPSNRPEGPAPAILRHLRGFQLIAGSAWNLATIDWIEAQLEHLGYPDYPAYILGACPFGAVVTTSCLDSG